MYMKFVEKIQMVTYPFRLYMLKKVVDESDEHENDIIFLFKIQIRLRHHNRTSCIKYIIYLADYM